VCRRCVLPLPFCGWQRSTACCCLVYCHPLHACSVFVCVRLRVWMAAERRLLLPCLLPSPLHDMQFVCMCVLCVLCVCVFGWQQSAGCCCPVYHPPLHGMQCVCMCVCCVFACLDGSKALFAVALFTALSTAWHAVCMYVCVVCVRVFGWQQSAVCCCPVYRPPLHGMECVCVCVCVCVCACVCVRVFGWQRSTACCCLVYCPLLHDLQFVCMCVCCVCACLDGSGALFAVAPFTALSTA